MPREHETAQSVVGLFYLVTMIAAFWVTLWVAEYTWILTQSTNGWTGARWGAMIGFAGAGGFIFAIKPVGVVILSRLYNCSAEGS